MAFRPTTLAPRDKEYLSADPECPGLVVRVFPTGKRTYYFRGRNRRVSASQIKLPLGKVGGITLDEARAQVMEYNSMLMRNQDPRRKYFQTEFRTFGQLWDDYLSVAKKTKRTWPEDERQYNKYLKRWQDSVVATIRKDDIRRLHLKVGEHAPVAANRLLALVHKVFQMAISMDLITVNPATAIEKFPERSRERFLSGSELEQFARSLTQESQDIQDYFLLSLLIAQRAGTMQSMRWDALDLDRGTWRLETTKNGDPLTVILVDSAVQILRRRMVDRESSEWVFPSHGVVVSKTGHIKNQKAAWKRICERAELDNVRIHDLRRTAASWMAADGTSLQIIGKFLGHKSLQATQIYSRLDQAPVRRAAETGSQKMMSHFSAISNFEE